MEFDSNHGGLPPINSANRSRKNYTWVYLLVIALLILSNILIFSMFNQSDDALPKQASAENNMSGDLVTEESGIKINAHYNAALAKLDQLSINNSMLEQQLKDKNSEISVLKNNIENILKNRNASSEDLLRAQKMIKDLEGKIKFYSSELNRYKKENQQLIKEKNQVEEQNQALQEENNELNRKLENARAFSANNIKIIPIELRKGGSEIETTKARRVDILRIQFDLIENNLIEPGSHTFYMRIIDPDGKLIYNTSSGSGSFAIQGIDLEQKYTKSRKIHISHSEPINNLNIDWEQSSDYPRGEYIIELYHEGSLIGKSIRQLR